MCLRHMMEPALPKEGACLRYMMHRNRRKEGLCLRYLMAAASAADPEMHQGVLFRIHSTLDRRWHRVVPGRGGADIGVPLNYSKIPLKYH